MRWAINLKMEVWAFMKYLQKKVRILKEIPENMVLAFAEDCPSNVTVEYKRNRDSTKDGPRADRPKTTTTDEQVDAIHRMDLDNRRLTIQQIAKAIGISSGSVPLF